MRGWKDEMSSKLMHEKGDFHIGAGKKDETKKKTEWTHVICGSIYIIFVPYTFDDFQ